MSSQARVRHKCGGCHQLIPNHTHAWYVVSLLGDLIYYHDECVDKAGTRGRTPKH